MVGYMPAYLSWLENPVHTRSVIGSNPIAGTTAAQRRLRGFFVIDGSGGSRRAE